MAQAVIILDAQVFKGGASRRAGGRDERPPLSSSPGATQTSKRWIPPSSLKRESSPALHPDDKYNGKFRRVRGTLNRLTPEKFDKLSLELLNVGIDSQVVLKGIILLIFEKALDEPKYSPLYAQLCKRLCEDAPNFEPPDSNISTFKKLLLNKCQDEFENRSRATEFYDQNDGPLSAAEEEQYVVAKHKMLGNIKFIGELGKLMLLHEGILHKCIQQLLLASRRTTKTMAALAAAGGVPDNIQPGSNAGGEDIECLCQIMRTVGRSLDKDKARAWMDQYFERMKVLMNNQDLPSRIRFMLQDAIELRSQGWLPRKILRENGPKTIQQVRHEAAREFGLNIPTPPSPGSTMIQPNNMDLFGRPLNNGPPMPAGSRVMQPQDVMFAAIPLSPPFMTGGGGGGLGIGTGPGTIHIDSFATGYGRRGNSNNYRGGGRGGGGGYNPNRRHQDDRDDMKFFPDDDPNNQRQNMRNKEFNGNSGGEDRGYYRNNQGNRSDNYQGYNNQYNNRDNQYNNPNFQKNNYQRREERGVTGGGGQAGREQQNQQMAQKDLDKLPPRFRKQLQMQQQQSPPNGSYLGEMNGSSTPPMDSRSPSHTPPPPQAPPAIGNKSTNEEINLRPANLRQFNQAFRPNIPSMLPKSTQIPQQMHPRHDYKAPLVVLDPPAPVIHTPQIIIPTKKTSQSQEKAKDKENKEKKEERNKERDENIKEPTAEELEEAMNTLLTEYIESGETKQAVKGLKDLKPPKDTRKEFVSKLIIKTLDQSEQDGFGVKLLVALQEAGIADSLIIMEGLNIVLDQSKSLEAEIPLVKSQLARLAGQLVSSDVISLHDLSEPMTHGAHYPLFLLCLQQLHKAQDKHWLLQRFTQAKINLMEMLPECERQKEGGMMDLLEDRGLSFLFPLLRVQTDLAKQLATDPNPTTLYKWIKDNVDASLYTDHGFIKILVTGLLKYMSGEGDLDKNSSSSIEREKELLSRYKGVLAHFLQDNIALQIQAIYSMQVFVHAAGFPKGMLLRLFMQMYDNEVIDEDAFLRWKEEVNDQYPGKGKALFQVNTWLTWLEQAESESDDEEEE